MSKLVPVRAARRAKRPKLVQLPVARVQGHAEILKAAKLLLQLAEQGQLRWVMIYGKPEPEAPNPEQDVVLFRGRALSYDDIIAAFENSKFRAQMEAWNIAQRGDR